MQISALRCPGLDGFHEIDTVVAALSAPGEMKPFLPPIAN